jgi:hypothetical protein
MDFSRLAQSVIFVAALVIGAQARAQVVSYGTYYDETASSFCGFNQTYCRVNFSQLPSTNLVKLKKIHCFAQTQTPGLSLANLRVATTSGGSPLSRFVPLPLAAVTPIASQYVTSIESEPEWLIGQSRFPFIEVGTVSQSLITVECTIVGELITPIQ